MKINDLQSLYVSELKDAYDAEHQILEALPRMAETATTPQLQEAFRRHEQVTQGHVERLEDLFGRLGEEPKRRDCKGMKGLLKEGEDVLKARGDGAAVDAALIGAAQRVEHYEIALYGTLRAFAEALGRNQDAKILQKTLDEESRTDEQLSRLAQSRINPRAVEEGVGSGTSRTGNGGLGRTRRYGNSGGTTKRELLDRARRLGIESRSRMNKQELQRAVERAT